MRNAMNCYELIPGLWNRTRGYQDWKYRQRISYGVRVQCSLRCSEQSNSLLSYSRQQAYNLVPSREKYLKLRREI